MYGEPEIGIPFFHILQMIIYPNDYFSIGSTLDCGQVFRYFCYAAGETFDCSLFCSDFERVSEAKATCRYDVYLVCSADRYAYLYEKDGKVVILSEDDEYFYNYFDLNADYAHICDSVIERSRKLGCVPNNFVPAVESGRGIRILRQAPWETLISFIISANNNIPRIKGIINRMCDALGTPMGCGKNSFPTAATISARPVEFYRSLGAGYRDAYIADTAQKVRDGYPLNDIFDMDRSTARRALATFKGVGAKVADCILLFGYHFTDAFPVDVWIDRAYRDMGGTETDRKKISAYLSEAFGVYSGYAQQYIFDYYMHNRNSPA